MSNLGRVAAILGFKNCENPSDQIILVIFLVGPKTFFCVFFCFLFFVCLEQPYIVTMAAFYLGDGVCIDP